MTHFACLVITASKPTEVDLEKALMPWHEYECTGYFNEYIQPVELDLTSEHVYCKTIADLKRDIADENLVVLNFTEGDDPGNLMDYVDKTTSYLAIKWAPSGREQIYDITNPNAKWDYWALGGRMHGMLNGHNQLEVKDLLE